MANVIWTPQAKQMQFMQRWENEALYGGAAGGGKSDCALAEGLRQVDIPHYRGIIFRKTYPQLTDLMDRSTEIYKKAFPRARFNESKHVWTFPSGSKIYFGSMQHTKDRLNYQGKHYDYIDFDELTQFLYEEYIYLLSRNRPNGPGTRCYIRAQANPGGIGHGWVKERFITAAKPMQTIWRNVNITFPDGHVETKWNSSIFVPSTVFDNQQLLQNDPEYVARLAALPEQERKALLYGDWDTFSGQVFTEWVNDFDHHADRRFTHVISPFKVPNTWSIWCGLDWGYTRPFSVAWYAVDHDRRMYRIREYYGCTGTPNTGVKLEPSEVARKIREIEDDDPNLKGKTIHRVGDPAIWQSDGTESIGDLMQRNGVYFERGDHARISGKMQCHYRLRFDENGVPMFYCFSTCKHFIRTIPALVYDEKDVEDIDTDGEDHIYDEWRYVCMENPIAPPEPKEVKPKPYDPLETPLDRIMNGSRYDAYEVYRI